MKKMKKNKAKQQLSEQQAEIKENEIPAHLPRSIGDRFAEARELLRQERYRLPLTRRR